MLHCSAGINVLRQFRRGRGWEIDFMLKTKTFWLGVITIGLGAAQYVNGDSANGSQNVIIGLGLIFGRQAIMGVK